MSKINEMLKDCINPKALDKIAKDEEMLKILKKAMGFYGKKF